MNDLNINLILNRIQIRNKIKNDLINLQNNICNDKLSRGFYIYGNSGVGKTTFIKNILRDLNYDIIYYNSNDIRNKNCMENLTTNKMSSHNIVSMFKRECKPIAIIMDDIHMMNNSDKGGLSSLTKIIRPKKTKKQKKELTTNIPIFCIGNYNIDKKTKELMKVSNVYELKNPTDQQIIHIIKQIINFKENSEENNIEENNNIIDQFVKYINYDLRKINNIELLYKSHNNILTKNLLTTILQPKINNEYTKNIVRFMINNKYSIDDHNILMNETDRTTISLLFHENIIDDINSKFNNDDALNIYMDILDNYTTCDYIDRITFQKQIWVFNEISSLLKNIYSNNIFHSNLEKHDYKNSKIHPKNKEIRFTKILTRYSTEYNNYNFIQDLCKKLKMDKKDMIHFFISLKNKFDDNDEQFYDYLNDLFITKLDVQRIYKFIENSSYI